MQRIRLRQGAKRLFHSLGWSYCGCTGGFGMNESVNLCIERMNSECSFNGERFFGIECINANDGSNIRSFSSRISKRILPVSVRISSTVQDGD